MTTAAGPDLLLVCPQCEKAELAFSSDGVECSTCGEADSPDALAKSYVERILGVSEYTTVSDGEVFPVFSCKECGGESLVRGVKPQPEGDSEYVHPSDVSPEAWACFSCGDTSLEGELVYCEEGSHVGTAMTNDMCVECFQAKVDSE